ncbi:serine/threonine-protein kinase VRK1-like [Tubulanus polymorphus]|uniref:serine/threonine-protein kinase VRK1-like n=1 Tax=Tubulanus polymorphus TaxID=672921 RepID=UPI003DA53588
MPRPAAKPKGKKPKASEYTLSGHVPEGTVLRDVLKHEWKVGKPIGQGGFGMIYLADVNSSKDVSPDAPYVLKIEPHSNGPLFCEIHFYQRVAKAALIEKWISEKRLKSLGVPKFVATGAHDLNGEKNRFMIMEHFGQDLQKLFEHHGKVFPRKTVNQLAIKILNSLQYVHSQEYVHADIKAANLLLALDPKGSNEVYLVDYGLATKYTSDNKAKEYKEDPKKAHDGTVEFTSIDAHKGVAPSRRGDLEILGYCLLQWLCSRLPWEDKLTNKNYVRDQKIKYMDDIPLLMKTCFPDSTHPAEIEIYLKKVRELSYVETPNYDAFRNIFIRALTKLGSKSDDKLEFELQKAATSRKRKSPTKAHISPKKIRQNSRVQGSDGLSDEQDVNVDKQRRSPTLRRSPRKRAQKMKKSNGTSVESDLSLSNGDGELPSWEQHLCKTKPPDRKKQKVSSTPSPATSRNKKTVVSRRRQKIGITVSTQTSPGLKGLRAMRKRQT